ncbi:hypothetical protein PF005_g10522 [Phytophthora fragariae]|uniref:ISXO2-like transposase domain-containing protein n=1 Tax=Phytophthora fragariae TaxID=53985 RepID=A0A6A3EXC6_9STRA|nr:hypothetical protein PF003_g27672 [Phytophthora fragariae]KAE8938059.1 hypothetical protein PF009_g12048 [Phytophthora fragariae]KAE9007294.1 hypothetical protein PF011_g11187 [Phytophthora fragariae]KAE9108596.1 hypothetical protein PF007_g12589 [Phytophthora fragariae]KAE9144870.1 hypothetical protein PF006_g10234 [Phytophthora fragariae]
MASPSPYMYHVEDESLFAMDKVIEITCDEALCIRWSMSMGLIDKEKLWPQCHGPMRLASTRKRLRGCRHQAAELAGASERTAYEYFAYCRSTCLKELLRAKIGGDGEVVEISDTSLAKKRKYNRGRHYEEFWLFGGVERGTGRWFGRIVYNKRTKETPLPIMKRFIKPRTHIMSDMFATYVR